MTYTYNPEYNSINVDPHTGMKVTDIYNKTKRDQGKKHPYPNMNWTKGTLYISDISDTKTFDIFIGIHKKEHFIKVAKQYHDFVFENVFGLGCQCANWDAETIIKIK